MVNKTKKRACGEVSTTSYLSRAITENILTKNLNLCLFQQILKWEVNTPYDVLVFVSSPHETAVDSLTCTEIYRTILSNYRYDEYTEANIASEKELDQAFKILRDFIEALAQSLLDEIPQTLLELAETGGRSKTTNEALGDNKKKGKKNKNGKRNDKPPPPPPAGQEGGGLEKVAWTSNKTKLNEARTKLKEGLKLPFF